MRRSLARVLVLCAAALAAPISVHAQPAAQVARAGAMTSVDWSAKLWEAGRSGQFPGVEALLDKVPPGDDAATARLAGDAARLRHDLAAREQQRVSRRDELRQKLGEALDKDGDDVRTSTALRWAIELQMLASDREAFLREPQMTGLINHAASAAHAAEDRGDWLIASELYYRLHALTEEQGKFKGDAERLTQRLTMLRLYVPHRLWELRNARALLEPKGKPLPEYNPIGLSFEEKLKGVDEAMVVRGVMKTGEHVDQVPLTRVLQGGLRAVRTMVTTTDLRAAFPGLSDAAGVEAMTGFLDREIAGLDGAKKPGVDQVSGLLERLRAENEKGPRVFFPAVLHEFGAGAVGELDEFSALIWPDELARFQRTTQGKVVGIGVQLQYDEQQNIQVVTPITGAPADRAGLRANDLITRVDGSGTAGMSLDQAVDLITGPANTQVTVTIGRRDADGTMHEQDHTLTRAIIDITTVRGWRRSGAGERDWDWFLDKDAGIGYVRLSQFTDTTTRDLDAAIGKMKESGLHALVLDLRYNPGGLLDQAVKVVRRFVGVEHGMIVSTAGQGGVVTERPQMTSPSDATLAGLPLIVLINENSASASEIVSGALRYYTRTGNPDATGAIPGLVLGARSFGKGSVQTLQPLGVNAMTKYTVQYYMVPDEIAGKRIIHRRPGATMWGIDPDLKVEMLPRQMGDANVIRRNADIARPGDPPPQPVKNADGELEPASNNPDDLLGKGLDLQLETAILLLRARLVGEGAAQARAEK